MNSGILYKLGYHIHCWTVPGIFVYIEK